MKNSKMTLRGKKTVTNINEELYSINMKGSHAPANTAVNSGVAIPSSLPIIGDGGLIWTSGHTGVYEQVHLELQNNQGINKGIERELRIAKLQELEHLTPGQTLELEILLNKKWK